MSLQDQLKAALAEADAAEAQLQKIFKEYSALN